MLEAAVRGSHLPLVQHSLAALDGYSAAAAGAPLAAAGSDALHRCLYVAADAAEDGAACEMLRALLASHLPFRQVVTDAKRVMLACAACGTAAAATVPLLHAAGAPLTLEALLAAVQACCRRGAAGGVACLLALGRPPVDMRTAVASVEGQLVFSCPIHCLLHTLVRPVILLETFENVYKT